MNQTARIRLSPRLQMAADMVREGVVAVDIGTDHAYLPVYLAENGLCQKLIASDLREGPLANARTTVELYSMADKITLRLSDGLDNIRPEEAQDFILAGMGGTLIASLLERASWLKDGLKRLIIQPMTHAEDVRDFLCKNGYKILFENACFEEHRCYIAICAEYDARAVLPRSPAYYYIGELPSCGNEAARHYLNNQNSRLKKRAEGLNKTGTNQEEITFLQGVMQEISEVQYA